MYGDELRLLHEKERSQGFGLTFPTFPAPYDDEKYDAFERYVNGYLSQGWIEASNMFEGVFSSRWDDPLDDMNITFANDLIQEFRELVTYPEWSVRIGNYPVPDWLNALAANTQELPYAKLEQKTASKILYHYGEVIDLIPLRALCMAMLKQHRNPGGEVDKFKERNVNNILVYINAICRKNGYDLDQLKKGWEE